jgi:hypothetical protein
MLATATTHIQIPSDVQMRFLRIFVFVVFIAFLAAIRKLEPRQEQVVPFGMYGPSTGG